MTAEVDQARRIVELMVLTAWADGRVEASEAIAIHKLEASFPELRAVGPAGDLSSAAKARLQRSGLEAAVREVASGIVDERYRQIAFQCCARVCGADGRYVDEEAAVLRLLEQAFGFSPQDVERMLVLALR